MQSYDVIGGNVAKIAALFPQCVTETAEKIIDLNGATRYESRLAIDFDKLRRPL